MFRIDYQTETWMRHSLFSNDEKTAVTKAKEIVSSMKNLDWLTVYSGYFGTDNMFHESNTIYDYDRCYNTNEIFN